jgi:muconate cycloisomerase
VTLRVDANMGWRSAAEALASIARLAPYELELVEQPLAREDLDGMRELRERSSVLVMADESVWTPRDALECVRRGAADVLNVYVSEAGGLRAAAAIFAIAEAAGIPCVVGSMPELGIGTAAQAHLAAAMRNLGFASDVNGCEYQADDVIRERLDIAGGHVRPPRGPGLGVTLDRDKVERYRVRDGEGA